MSLPVVVLIVVLAWLVLLAVGTATFALRMRQRRTDVARDLDGWQEAERRAPGDRRIGLPDPRPVQIERRRGERRRAAAA